MNVARKTLYFVRHVGITTAFFRVIRRVLDNLLRRNRPVLSRETTVTLLSGRKLLLNPNDSGFSIDVLLGNGLREPLASKHLLESLPDLRTFVDLGANIGYYSVLLTDNFEEIIAIEPLQESFCYLVRNIEVNDLIHKIRAIHAAVSTEDGYTYVTSHENRNWTRISDTGERVRAISLPSLQDQFGPIDMIKMDIEGHEKNLITGIPDWWKDVGPRYLFYEHHMNLFSPEVNATILTTLHDAGYYIEIAFDEINPPIAWRSAFLRRVHSRVFERSLRPKGLVFYRNQSLADVLSDQLVLDGRYGSVEFILRKREEEQGLSSAAKPRYS